MAENLGKQVDSSAEKADEIVLAEIVVTETVVAEIVMIEKSNLSKNRIPIKILKNINILYEFLEGRKITVILSSGIIDYGWEITPRCYQYFVKKPNLGNYWLFEVKKKNLTKVIKLIDLKNSIDEKDHYIVDDLIEIFDLNSK